MLKSSKIILSAVRVILQFSVIISWRHENRVVITTNGSHYLDRCQIKLKWYTAEFTATDSNGFSAGVNKKINKRCLSQRWQNPRRKRVVKVRTCQHLPSHMKLCLVNLQTRTGR